MSRILLPMVLFGALIMFSGCSAKKKLISAEKVRRNPTPETLITYLKDRQLQFEWLTARARIFYEDEQQTVNATLHLRMRQDSLIWLSFRKFNIEAARVKITTDSVFILNRLDKQYAIFSIAELEVQYGLPANFDNLQTLVKGGMLLDPARKISLSNDEDSYLLSQETGQLTTSAVINIQNLFLQKLKFRSGEQLLNLDLEEYDVVSNHYNFSYLREISIFSRSLGQISCHLNFSKVELNIPKSIRFEIPERYTRMPF